MEKLEVYYRTDKGRKRTANEDNVLVRQIGDMHLLAVADGLGGHAAGAVASKMALIELEEFFKACLKTEPTEEIMNQAIYKANKEIYLLSEENPDYAGMGSTLVAALISANNVIIANVGDSRAYLVKDGIRQITRDHSLIQEMVDKGTLSQEEARHHAEKNIVTRVLGTAEEVQAEFFDLQLNGGILLLCSDGLIDILSDGQILEILTNYPRIETACNQLIDRANEEGSRDNISVILAKRN